MINNKFSVKRSLVFSLFIFGFPGNSKTTELISSGDQQQVAKKNESNTPQQVEIVAKTGLIDLARDDVVAKRIIKAEVLSRYGDSNLADALQKISGIIVNNGNVQLTGLGGVAQILVDGQRPPRGFSIDSISPSTVDRLEVYRVATAEFSTQATSGTINIILKRVDKKVDTKFIFSLENKYSLSEKADWQFSRKDKDFSYNNTFTVRLDRNQFGRGFTRSSKSWNQEDNLVQNQENQGSGDSKRLAISFVPRLLWKLDSASEIGLNSSFTIGKANSHGYSNFISLLGVQPDVSDSNNEGSRSTNTLNSTLFFKQKFDDESLFDIRIKSTTFKNISESIRAGSRSGNGIVLDRNEEAIDGEREFGISTKYSVPITKSHDFVTGIEGATSQSNYRSDRFDQIKIANGNQALFQSTDATVQNFALFAQDIWKLREGASIYLGLRWEGMNIESAGNLIETSKYRSDTWSPIIQSLWKLVDDNENQIRFGLARTYKAPDSIALLSPKESNLNNSAQNPNFEGNPNLKPELAWSLEVALEHESESLINYTIRSYIKRIQDLQRPVTFLKSGFWITKYLNESAAYSKGVAFDVNFPVKKLGIIDIDANAQFSIDKSWSEVSRVPGPDNRYDPSTLTVVFGLDYQSARYPLKAGFNYRFSNGGLMNLSHIEKRYEPYARDLSIYGNWRFDKKTQISASLNNLIHKYQPRTSIYENEDRSRVITTFIGKSVVKFNIAITHLY